MLLTKTLSVSFRLKWTDLLSYFTFYFPFSLSLPPAAATPIAAVTAVSNSSSSIQQKEESKGHKARGGKARLSERERERGEEWRKRKLEKVTIR